MLYYSRLYVIISYHTTSSGFRCHWLGLALAILVSNDRAGGKISKQDSKTYGELRGSQQMGVISHSWFGPVCSLDSSHVQFPHAGRCSNPLSRSPSRMGRVAGRLRETCVCIYVHIYIYIYICIYVFMYTQRERERDR